MLLILSRFSRVRLHRRQPTRLTHPWDSPGKNTGMGCHFLFQCMKVKSEKSKLKLLSHVLTSATSWTTAYQAPPSMGLSRHEDWSGLPLPSPAKAPGSPNQLYFSEKEEKNEGKRNCWGGNKRSTL